MSWFKTGIILLADYPSLVQYEDISPGMILVSI